MKTITKLTSVLFLLQIIATGFVSCTSDNDMAEMAIPQDSGIHTCVLKFHGNVMGYDDKHTRAVTDEMKWKDGSTVFVKFMTGGSSFIAGAAEYKEKPNTWVISYKGSLSQTTNGKCSVFYFDSIASTSGDSLVNLSRLHASYCTEQASYSFNGIEISINANLSPMNGRIRFLGDSIENFKTIGITSLKSFNCKTFTFSHDTTEVNLTCQNSSSIPNRYFTDYVYGEFSNEASRSLAIESKHGYFRRSCASVDFSAGKSGYIQCPMEDNYYGWTPSKDDADIFSDAVDLGLSVLWAKKNLGADYDYEYGYYTSWGDGEGTNNKNSSNTVAVTEKRWIPVKESYKGNTQYDRATSLLGNQWYTPSDTEWNELMSCQCIYVSKQNQNGFKVIGNNGNSIYFPLAECIEGNATPYTGVAFAGYYWSSSYAGSSVVYESMTSTDREYYGSCCELSKDENFKLAKLPMFKKCSIRPVKIKSHE